MVVPQERNKARDCLQKKKIIPLEKDGQQKVIITDNKTGTTQLYMDLTVFAIQNGTLRK